MLNGVSRVSAFLDASFNVILSGLTYVQDKSTATTELARVLKPGGRLALTMLGAEVPRAYASLGRARDDRPTADPATVSTAGDAPPEARGVPAGDAS